MRRLAIVFGLLLLLAPAARAGEPPSGEMSEGERVFRQRCTDLCHQTPFAAHLSSRQWRAVLNTMQKRMEQAGMVPMSEREYELVLDHLSARAGH